MGAIFRVPTAAFDEAPHPVVGLVPRGGTPLAELELGERVAFVLGAERDGLPAEVTSSCDELASLNVAVAGAIALYEFSRLGA